MPECLPIIPGNCGVGQNADGSWRYERLHGVTPQGPAPWADRPATATITPADRLALVVCVAVLPGSKPCKAPCHACRVNSAAVARELAVIARENPEGSIAADWIEGVVQ